MLGLLHERLPECISGVTDSRILGARPQRITHESGLRGPAPRGRGARSPIDRDADQWVIGGIAVATLASIANPEDAMTRTEPKSTRWMEEDAEIARDAARQADDDAAAAILAMLTSGRPEPDLLCDADGQPLSTAAYEGRVMWF
jgi:hypothetical protein